MGALVVATAGRRGRLGAHARRGRRHRHGGGPVADTVRGRGVDDVPLPPSPEATTDAPPARPRSLAEAATAFRRDLVAGRDDGAISQKAADELDHRVSEVVAKDQEGKAKEVRKKARELVDKVDELAEKGEITAPELAEPPA